MNEILYDNILDLCDAIVRMACKDYEAAYRAGNTSKYEALEKTFFYTPWFDALVRGQIHPDSILREIRKKVDENNSHFIMNKRRTPENGYKKK